MIEVSDQAYPQRNEIYGIVASVPTYFFRFSGLLKMPPRKYQVVVRYVAVEAVFLGVELHVLPVNDSYRFSDRPGLWTDTVMNDDSVDGSHRDELTTMSFSFHASFTHGNGYRLALWPPWVHEFCDVVADSFLGFANFEGAHRKK